MGFSFYHSFDCDIYRCHSFGVFFCVPTVFLHFLFISFIFRSLFDFLVDVFSFMQNSIFNIFFFMSAQFSLLFVVSFNVYLKYGLGRDLRDFFSLPMTTTIRFCFSPVEFEVKKVRQYLNGSSFKSGKEIETKLESIKHC